MTGVQRLARFRSPLYRSVLCLQYANRSSYTSHAGSSPGCRQRPRKSSKSRSGHWCWYKYQLRNSCKPRGNFLDSTRPGPRRESTDTTFRIFVQKMVSIHLFKLNLSGLPPILPQRTRPTSLLTSILATVLPSEGGSPMTVIRVLAKLLAALIYLAPKTMIRQTISHLHPRKNRPPIYTVMAHT